MRTTKLQNTKSIVDMGTSSNGWKLLSTLFKFACALSLIVLVGYIYINLNNQNKDLHLELTEITKQLQDNSYIKQNIDNKLLQKANAIDKEKNLDAFGLMELDKTQIVVLDAPDYDHNFLLQPKDKQKTAKYQSPLQLFH